MATTTTSTITALISGYVYQTPLAVAQLSLPHLTYAMRSAVPAGSGSRWTARRPTKLTKQTATLTEGSSPASNTLGVTDVAINLIQLGNFFTISDVATQVEPVPLAMMYGPLLQLNIAESLDKVTQAIVVGGTTVYYANSVAARANVAQKLVANDLDKTIKYLQAQSARPISQIILPNNNVAGNPIGASYIMIAHPDVCSDLATSVTGYKEVQNYASPDQRFPGEHGAYRNIRVIMSENADDGTAQVGAAGTTVYKNNAANFYVYLNPVFGAEAFAAIDFSNLEYTEVTTASDADPLAQRKSTGWKQLFNAGILNQTWLVRLECAASL